MRWLLLSALLLMAAANGEVTLRVMTFNIWYGGEQVSFAETVKVIRLANPDLIAVQEPDGNLHKLAELAGYSFVDPKRNIISRFPLFDPDTKEKRHVYTHVLVRPGQIVAIANIHTTSSPSGADMLRDGKSVAEVLETERKVRLREVQPYLEDLKEALVRKLPVFFAGDFNTPSHLDWHAGKSQPKVEWPVTVALVQAGFRDSFREVHPDPAAKPGLTWTPGYPHPYRKKEEVQERIDMIWIAGEISTVESKIIGEPDNPEVDFAVSPYPSDHRAVVSTFRVKPAAAPAMIAVEPTSFQQGTDFLVRFQTPDFGDWNLLIVRPGDESARPIVSAKGPTVISTRPSMKFSSHEFQPGRHEAVLFNAKNQELARTDFFVLEDDAEAQLRSDKKTYRIGEPITVHWTNAPGMKNDWVGLYRAGDPDLFSGYIAFVYTGALIEGSAVLDDTVIHQTLPAGKYEVRLFREDSYVLLATAEFTIEN